IAPPIRGPRHTMGWPSGTKNWMEIAFTPWRSRGTILPDSLARGWPSSPSIIGMLGPVMSASSRPTDAPARARATARFTDTVLLPTPPLPDATAMTFFRPARSCSAVRGAARGTAPRGPPPPPADGRVPRDRERIHAERRERASHLALDLVLERARGRRE